jgi:hypothetical protein
LFETVTGQLLRELSQPHPLDHATVLDIARRVGRFTFDRVYGSRWGKVVDDGAATIRSSADHYGRTPQRRTTITASRRSQ